MTIGESMEQWEAQYLSPYASLSRETRGRGTERAALRYPAGISERQGSHSSL